MTPSGPPGQFRPRIARRPRALASHAILLGGVTLAALAACARIGEDVFSHETAPFDEPIRAWMLHHQTNGVRRLFLVVTHAGAPMSIIPVTAAAAIWLRATRGLPIAGAVVLAPTVALALFVAIKKSYRRARPAGAEALHQRTYAFPSGHAAASAAIFGTLAYVLWREGILPAGWATALSTMPTLLIGTSRVYLDVHWSTDVLGGWSLGALVTAMSALVYEQLRSDTRAHGAAVTRHG